MNVSELAESTNAEADAESTGNPVENVVRIDGSHDLAEFGQGEAYFSGDQLFPAGMCIELPRLFHGITSHVFGTAVIGPDAANSVVGTRGELHGAPGIYVADASMKAFEKAGEVINDFSKKVETEVKKATASSKSADAPKTAASTGKASAKKKTTASRKQPPKKSSSN